MDIDQEKIEETVLALLYLTSFGNKSGLRAWKGHDWGVMNALHEKGYISNPATKAKWFRQRLTARHRAKRSTQGVW